MPNFEPFVAEEHKQEATGFELLPVGTYEFAITKTEMKTGDNGRQSLELQNTVQSGPYQGRIVFTSLYMVAPPDANDGQKMAVKIGKGTLSSIVTAVGLAALTTSYDQLLGIPFMGEVAVELGKPNPKEPGSNYPDRNKIKKYMAKGAAAPVAASVAAGPWAK